jgi:hypothetical protein
MSLECCHPPGLEQAHLLLRLDLHAAAIEIGFAYKRQRQLFYGRWDRMSGDGGRGKIGSPVIDCPLPSSLRTGPRGLDPRGGGGNQLQRISTGESAAVEVMLPAAKAFY